MTRCSSQLGGSQPSIFMAAGDEPHAVVMAAESAAATVYDHPNTLSVEYLLSSSSLLATIAYMAAPEQLMKKHRLPYSKRSEETSESSTP